MSSEIANDEVRKLLALRQRHPDDLSGPTDEQVRAAHEANAVMRKAGLHNWADTMEAILPPLPSEQSTPMISRVDKLAQRVWNLTAPGESFGENCIRGRDAEIIAVSEWNMKICTIFGSLPCPRCETLRDLIRALRNANYTAPKG